jgi:hypothetical protein
VAENGSGGYGSLSHAGRHFTNIPQHDSVSSNSINFSALLHPLYSSTSDLTSQQSQNCGNAQQLHFASSGNIGHPLNTTVSQQLSHEHPAIITTQGGSPEQQQYWSNSSRHQQPVRCASSSGVSMLVSEQLSSVSSPTLMLQGKSSIHNANPITSSTLLSQNKTELLVKEIATLNFNKVWNETASKVKPDESLSCLQNGSSLSSLPFLSLVPHSTTSSGSVTSVSHQKICPSDKSGWTPVCSAFSSLSSVCSNSPSSGVITTTVIQGTRTSGVPAEKCLPSSSNSLGSPEFHNHGISSGNQAHSRCRQCAVAVCLNVIC